jgi:hypothetical protein
MSLILFMRRDQIGAFLRILEPAISTDGPMGQMVLKVLGMVAEMELGFIKARHTASTFAAICPAKGQRKSQICNHPSQWLAHHAWREDVAANDTISPR